MENPEIPIVFAKTSISAGLIVGELLAGDPAIKAIATDVFPIVTEKANLPYISFRASGMESVPTKERLGAETLQMEVNCFSDTYAGSVYLAECARNALDRRQYTMDGITMRTCFFEDRQEDYQDDAFVQQLIFRIKI